MYTPKSNQIFAFTTLPLAATAVTVRCQCCDCIRMYMGRTSTVPQVSPGTTNQYWHRTVDCDRRDADQAHPGSSRCFFLLLFFAASYQTEHARKGKRNPSLIKSQNMTLSYHLFVWGDEAVSPFFFFLCCCSPWGRGWRSPDPL